MPYGVVGIQLDKARLLLYGTAAVVEAERRMDKSVVRAISERSFTDLVTLLWAGLRHEDAKLTPEAVMKAIDTAKRKDGVSAFMLWEKVADGLVASGILPAPEPPESAPVSSENPT